jgi:hypothetical protein
MNILWCGGEDIDFPNGGTASAQTTTGLFRSSWTRCGLKSTSATAIQSNVFPGGAVTSCWLSFQWERNNGADVSMLACGLTKSGSPQNGLWLGINSSDGSKVSLYKYDGTTKTLLASGPTGTYVGNTVLLYRWDIQVISYGATATVNVYLSGSLLFTFTGDVTITGMTSMSAVSILANTGNTGAVSEVIVADSDTRGILGLSTMALTGAGTTDAWASGTFSNINGISFSDTTPAFTNTTGQDEQFNVTDVTAASTYSVLAVKISARAASPAGSTATKLKLGYNSGGTVAFGTGATQVPGTSFGTLEQLDATNPVTSAAFQSSEMNALQLDFQSTT